MNRLPIWNSQNCSMFPLAFVAGSLQGHWWGFISRNYVVWPIFFLMNVFIALKGTHFWILFIQFKSCLGQFESFLVNFIDSLFMSQYVLKNVSKYQITFINVFKHLRTQPGTEKKTFSSINKEMKAFDKMFFFFFFDWTSATRPLSSKSIQAVKIAPQQNWTNNIISNNDF